MLNHVYFYLEISYFNIQCFIKQPLNKSKFKTTFKLLYYFCFKFTTTIIDVFNYGLIF